MLTIALNWQSGRFLSALFKRQRSSSYELNEKKIRSRSLEWDFLINPCLPFGHINLVKKPVQIFHSFPSVHVLLWWQFSISQNYIPLCTLGVMVMRVSCINSGLHILKGGVAAASRKKSPVSKQSPILCSYYKYRSLISIYHWMTEQQKSPKLHWFFPKCVAEN